jgi:hypothetical protein
MSMSVGAPPADPLTLLASTMGLGFLSGFRLYASVLTLGLAIRFGWLSLGAQFAGLSLLSDTRVLAVAGVLAAVEFLADKIPWIDSAWDSVHAFIRPLAAAGLAVAAFGEMDGVARTVLGLVAGTVAFSTHSAKAATRLAVNHSPEPFSNVAVSFAEDVAAPAALWLVWSYPLVFLALLLIFLTVFALLAPRAYRLIRLEFAALAALLRQWFGEPATPPAATLWLTRLPGGEALASRLEPLPAGLVTQLGNCSPDGLRGAATASLNGLKRSIGYLCLVDNQLVFATRRNFRRRRHAIPLSDIRALRLRSGLLMDELVLETARGIVRFDLFKAPTPAPRPAAAAALSS